MGEQNKEKEGTGADVTLSFKERAGYGVGDFASNMMYSAVNAFMSYFFTNVAHLSAGIAGSIMLFSRVFDGFSDVCIGVGMEKVKSKHGKARPWLLWGAIPFAISLVMLFSAPDLSMRAKIIYAFLTYNLATTIMYTAVNLPFGSLAAMMTQNQYERGVLNVSKMICAFTGQLVISLTTLPMVEMFKKNLGVSTAKGWQYTYMIFGALAAFFFLVTFFSTKERVGDATAGKDREDTDIKKAIKNLPKNKYWVVLLVIFFVYNAVNSIVLGVSTYYCQYILNDANLFGKFSLWQIGATLITLFILTFLVKRIGKRNTAIVASLTSILGCVVALIAPKSIPVLIVSFVLKGIGAGGFNGVIYGMLADTIEYNEWVSGIRAEGLVFSANSVGIKFGQGIGVALLGWILQMVNYDGTNQVTQVASAISGIKFIFLILPLILFFVQMLLLFLYKLDKEYAQIMVDLEQRHMAEKK